MNDTLEELVESNELAQYIADNLKINVQVSFRNGIRNIDAYFKGYPIEVNFNYD